jgi:hypothetical protein
LGRHWHERLGARPGSIDRNGAAHDEIAQGGAGAAAEADRTVSEKVAAPVELQKLALTGGLGFGPETAASKTLAHYRRKVRANRRRLSGP